MPIILPGQLVTERDNDPNSETYGNMITVYKASSTFNIENIFTSKTCPGVSLASQYPGCASVNSKVEDARCPHQHEYKEGGDATNSFKNWDDGTGGDDDLISSLWTWVQDTFSSSCTEGCPTEEDGRLDYRCPSSPLVWEYTEIMRNRRYHNAKLTQQQAQPWCDKRRIDCADFIRSGVTGGADQFKDRSYAKVFGKSRRCFTGKFTGDNCDYTGDGEYCKQQICNTYIYIYMHFNKM